MLQDFYHNTDRAVSGVLRWMPAVLLACVILLCLSDLAFAELATKEALINKGTTVSAGFTEVIKGWAKPLGSIVIIALFVLMIFVGKQVAGKFAFVIIGLIGAAMAGTIAAVIWAIGGGT